MTRVDLICESQPTSQLATGGAWETPEAHGSACRAALVFFPRRCHTSGFPQASWIKISGLEKKNQGVAGGEHFLSQPDASWWEKPTCPPTSPRPGQHLGSVHCQGKRSHLSAGLSPLNPHPHPAPASWNPKLFTSLKGIQTYKHKSMYRSEYLVWMWKDITTNFKF